MSKARADIFVRPPEPRGQQEKGPQRIAPTTEPGLEGSTGFAAATLQQDPMCTPLSNHHELLIPFMKPGFENVPAERANLRSSGVAVLFTAQITRKKPARHLNLRRQFPASAVLSVRRGAFGFTKLWLLVGYAKTWLCVEASG